MKKNVPPKQVRKRRKKYANDDRVLDLLRRGKNPAQICNDLSIPKSSMTRILRRLNKDLLINKVGYGTYEISAENIKKRSTQTSTVGGRGLKKTSFQKSLMGVDSIRGHGMVFTFQIPHVSGLDGARGEYFLRNFPDLCARLMRGGLAFVFSGRKVHLWARSLVIYDSGSHYADRASLAKAEGIVEILAIVKALERRLGAPHGFRMPGGYQVRVSREHYAMVRNALAELHEKNREKLQVFNEKGLWLLIDNSLNLHELEVIKNREDRAVLDSEAVARWWNDQKQHGFKVTASYTLEMMTGIMRNQKIFDANMASHIDAVRALADGVRELRSEIRKLNKGTRHS